MMIGNVSIEKVFLVAKSLESIGGPKAPLYYSGLNDFPITGPLEINMATRIVAEHYGGVLMSSGGTTGKPKLTWNPYHLALGRLLQSWRPLRPGNVLLNLFNAGRMWGSHYYMQSLAEKSMCTVMPSGPYTPKEVSVWISMFKEVGLDSLAGTPTGLADFAEGVINSKESLPIKVIIWMGEPWTVYKRELIRQAFPEAELWGNYGSVESWVMGTNGPGCDETVLHLLPDQVIEPDQEGALLTRVGDGWTVPTVRYRLGDLVEPAECQCGQPHGFRIIGRADRSFSLRSAIFQVDEILQTVRMQPGIIDAQLVLVRSDDTPKSANALSINFTGTAESTLIRKKIIEEFHHLAAIDRQYSDAIAVHQVVSLKRIERTNKIPEIIWKGSSDS